MCGLVGCITKNKNGFSNDQLDIFEDLLAVDTLRGGDSTGVFLVNSLGNVGIVKDVGSGWRFRQTKEWNEARSHAFTQGRVLIGHNRKATRGSVSDTNAHPFWVEDKLVLVHNGSYFGSHKHIKDVEVDSHAIAHHLADHPDDIEGALKKINAAYALIWYNVDKKEVNFIRNPERPLAWVETKDAWYYASEGKMLDFVLSRNNIDTTKAIFEFPDYNHNVWKMTDAGGWEISSETLDCKYRGAVTNFQNGNSWYNSDACGYGPAWQDELDVALEATAATASQSALPALPAPSRKKDTIAVMPWMTKATYREYKEFAQAYCTGTRVKVIIDDFIDDDNNSGTVTVSGKVLDKNSLRASFNLPRKTLDMVTSPADSSLEDAVFEVTVKRPVWTRTDSRDLRDIEDANGIVTLHCKDPEIIFNSSGHGVH